jgi:hypothetical protein
MKNIGRLLKRKSSFFEIAPVARRISTWEVDCETVVDRTKIK